MLYRCSILVFSLLFPITVLVGQTPKFGKPEILFKSGQWEAVNPQWSPDGEYIALSTPQYKGLYLLSSDTDFQKIEQLTKEAAAGYAYRWSPDGQYIVARVARFDQAHRLDAIQWFSVKDRKSRNITGFDKDAPGLPQWMGSIDTIGYFNKDKLHLLSSGLKDRTVKVDTSLRLTFITDSEIIITDGSGNIVHKHNPVHNTRYHSAIVSPDNRKLVFQAGGKLHLMNINGTNHREVGRGNAPTWSPHGKYLAYEVSKDDGHQYTAADIYIYDLTTDAQFNLTADFDQLAVQPDWSHDDGSRLIFTTLDDGTIYSIDIKK